MLPLSFFRIDDVIPRALWERKVQLTVDPANHPYVVALTPIELPTTSPNKGLNTSLTSGVLTHIYYCDY